MASFFVLFCVFFQEAIYHYKNNYPRVLLQEEVHFHLTSNHFPSSLLPALPTTVCINESASVKPSLAPTDGAQRSRLVPGTGSGCEWWLRRRLWV